MGIVIQNNVQDAILYTLAYFDIFDYPLNCDEIAFFAPIDMDEQLLRQTLQTLVSENHLFCSEELYSLQHREDIFSLRKNQNALAQQMMPLARQYGLLILRFPFIKGVCISGSLSKDVFNQDDDFDFFIIAAKNRVWLARLLLKAYKFFWLKNSREYFCINYFISESDLEIKEKNLFTAIELVTLLPMMEKTQLQALQQQNRWLSSFLPNAKWKPMLDFSIKKPLLSRWIEFLCWRPVGNALDLMVMKFITVRNRIKYRDITQQQEFLHMFKATRTESKIHPLNMSKKIQDKHRENLQTLEIESV